MATLTFSIAKRRGADPVDITLPATATLDDLKAAWAKHVPLDPLRMSFAVPVEGARPRAVADEKPLGQQNLAAKQTLLFKDKGPQVAWRTVYIIEYLGPLVIPPILYFLRPAALYGANLPEFSLTQTVGFALWMLHFAKRMYETIFVHHWGPKATLSVHSIWQNSAYYWTIGFAVNYFLLHPLYTAPGQLALYAGVGIWTVAELSNFYIHYYLSRLRTPGTRERKIPKGFFFNLVSCPNYTTEILAWAAFNLATCTLAGIVFNVAGAYIMMGWAIARQKRYKRSFPDYPKRRKAIFPFLV